MKIGREREAYRLAKMADWERAFADRLLLPVAAPFIKMAPEKQTMLWSFALGIGG